MSLHTKVQMRRNQLATDHMYINELIADMFDAEGNDRHITPADVTRLQDVIFNTRYLTDIATSQVLNEQEPPMPHGFARNLDKQLLARRSK
jgi:hypothetical protein